MNNYAQREIERSQPRGYDNYMANYGEHFSKAMCRWAVSMMKGADGKFIEPWSKEKVEATLDNYGVSIDNDKGYDKVYVMNMCRADFLGHSVPDDSHMAQYVKDLLDDPDGYEGLVFNRFVMDCMGKNIPIDWEDML